MINRIDIFEFTEIIKAVYKYVCTFFEKILYVGG